jgi:hypothetical protein
MDYGIADCRIDIPIASNLLDLTNDSHGDSGVFQKRVAEFLSTSYGQMNTGDRHAISRINSQLFEVERNCQNKYLAAEEIGSNYR